MSTKTTSTVIITGGNRGIGRALTEAFVKASYHVVVGARHDTAVEKQFPGAVTFVRADVREPAAHEALVKAARERTGRLDVYINNAGYSEWRPLDEIDPAFLDDMLATNLKGVLWGCKAAARALATGGVIINISSIAGKRGSANNAAYCASKFGVNGVTQALAKELGPRGIRVNAVCPVLIATEGLTAALRGPAAPGHSDADAFLRKFTADNAALKRLPEGSEVGGLCVFLASAAASAITGQCINLDCGVFPQ